MTKSREQRSFQPTCCSLPLEPQDAAAAYAGRWGALSAARALQASTKLSPPWAAVGVCQQMPLQSNLLGCVSRCLCSPTCLPGFSNSLSLSILIELAKVVKGEDAYGADRTQQPAEERRRNPFSGFCQGYLAGPKLTPYSCKAGKSVVFATLSSRGTFCVWLGVHVPFLPPAALPASELLEQQISQHVFHWCAWATV